MKNRLYVSENGTEYEIYDNKIMVEHENGYYGCLCGKSSMSIFKGNKEVLHTGFRNINTPDELYKQLSEMPSFMEILSEGMYQKECIKTMRIEFHADNGEMLTPLEVANSLINQNTFKVDELRELAEHLQVYCRHHNDKEEETISF